MPIDPRLNCAAEICCSPPQSLAAATEILAEAGLTRVSAESVARNLRAAGVALLPVQLAAIIREIAFGNGVRTT